MFHETKRGIGRAAKGGKACGFTARSRLDPPVVRRFALNQQRIVIRSPWAGRFTLDIRKRRLKYSLYRLMLGPTGSVSNRAANRNA